MQRNVRTLRSYTTAKRKRAFVYVCVVCLQGDVLCASCATPVDSQSDSSSAHDRHDDVDDAPHTDYFNADTLPCSDTSQHVRPNGALMMMTSHTASTTSTSPTHASQASSTSSSPMRFSQTVSPRSSPLDVKQAPVATSVVARLPHVTSVRA